MSKKYIIVSNHDELYHHGIKGQKWGVRRFQNEDGSLTPAGVKRYQTDPYGNMTKKGAANYYRDIYNEAKAMGYRGQGVHDYVRQHFNNEGEYQAFVDNYRKYKGQKAVKGALIGTAGAATAAALTTAAVGAGTYGIARGVSKLGKKGYENAILDINRKYYGGHRMENLSFNKLSEMANTDPSQFNTKAMRQEARVGKKAAAILAKRRLQEDNKQAIDFAKKNMNDAELLGKTIQMTNRNARSMPVANKLDRAAQKSLQEREQVLRKMYKKQVRKESRANLRDATMDQYRIETGKEAIQNRMNAFSNSLFGQIASGAGTTIGAMYVNAQVEASRKAIANMYDQDTANRIAPNSLKIKEYKDRSSVLTMPQRMDKAWENTLKGNTNTSSKSNDDDDDEDEDEKKRRS